MAGVASSVATWAPVALSAASTGAKAAGQAKGGRAGANTYGYQAQVARRNATVNRMRADRAIQGGIAGADLTSLRGANVLGSVKAKQAASGVNINTGSSVDVRSDIAKANKFDAESVLRNAELTAWGYRRQADNDDAQAGLYDQAATGVRTGADLAMGGTLLEGASAAPWGWLKGMGDGSDSGPGAPTDNVGMSSNIDADIAEWSKLASV